MISCLRRMSLIVSAAALLASVTVADVRSDSLSTEDKAAVEKLIESYILENPQIVIEAIRKFQAQEQAAEEARQREAIAELREQLENAATSPARGNLEGDVTLVEFFDYRCPYCKRSHKTVMEAVKKDGNVRLIYKEFPILGPESTFAARASLGVFYTAPDRYNDFHDAMMTAAGGLNQERILQIAADVGISADDLQAGMRDPRVDREIAHNMALAQSLGINGTPAYIIDQNLLPGAVDLESLLAQFANARGG